MTQNNTGINYEAAVKLLQQAYAAFNNRDIDAALQLMHTDVHWPNGWEGGYVNGHNEVRDYWQRQWAAIDPHVEPVSFEETPNGRIIVNVQQLVKDLQGNILSNKLIKHIYTFENGLVHTMRIA